MVTVIVTAATAVIVSGCYRDEKLGTTPNHTERDTVCHQHLWHCVPYIYSATETSFNTSGHSGDGMMLGTTSTQGDAGRDAGESSEREKVSAREAQQMQSCSIKAPRVLHGRSMARSPVRPFSVKRHTDMGQQARIWMRICTTYLTTYLTCTERLCAWAWSRMMHAS